MCGVGKTVFLKCFIFAAALRGERAQVEHGMRRNLTFSRHLKRKWSLHKKRKTNSETVSTENADFVAERHY